MIEKPLTRWQGHLVARIDKRDAAMLAILVLLAAGSVATGAAGARMLSLQSAGEVAAMVKTSTVTDLLPDARLEALDGRHSTLAAEAGGRPAVVAVVGPAAENTVDWLVSRFADSNDLAFVVPRKDLLEPMANELANKDRQAVPLFVDAQEMLTENHHVTRVPTTFLLDEKGRPVASVVGFNERALERLQRHYHLLLETP